MSMVPRRGPGGGGGSSSLAARPEWVGVSDNSAVVMDRGNQSMIRMSASAQDHVNAYLEYERIVGDADGGKLLSEEEYAAFKANAIAHRANRIYVSWRCLKSGIDCRMVGPTSPCFCGHRFRQHATDNHNKQMHCRQAGCACTLYSYIPVRGTQDVKCTCHHSYDVHSVTGKRRCKNAGCACAGFASSLSCACREQYGAHATVFETKEERQAAGRPVDNLAGGGAGYEALGGITSFSSLVEGVDRLALGAGDAPEQLDAPPLRSNKLKAEDEFALYDAKYKGKSSVDRGAGAGSSSSSAMRGRAAAASSSADDYASPAALPAGSGGMAGGGDALSLFLTSALTHIRRHEESVQLDMGARTLCSYSSHRLVVVHAAVAVLLYQSSLPLLCRSCAAQRRCPSRSTHSRRWRALVQLVIGLAPKDSSRRPIRCTATQVTMLALAARPLLFFHCKLFCSCIK
jgi:hypothetical protein